MLHWSLFFFLAGSVMVMIPGDATLAYDTYVHVLTDLPPNLLNSQGRG